MLVFIDESGDAGFKIEKGSSRFFVVCCVIFSDELEAEKTSVAIKELKRTMKLPDNLEFKFNLANKIQRLRFLNLINKFDFIVRCLVVDKKNIRSNELRNNKNSFYSYMVKTLLEHSYNDIFNAKIRIDGSGDRLFKRNFSAYLRKQLNYNQKCLMDNLKIVDSRTNSLIQMSDMIAGSIRRKYEGLKNDSEIYFSTIKKHIKNSWLFK